ncbi:hypothetical protein BDW59DRAFT_164256 [Aspergillus cavernicola]|uniref:RING-type domain-containing protein n=1 Tax=Aspergillus cavernicola TaxID=176166 RepID=A0ABR4I0U1_9EURO
MSRSATAARSLTTAAALFAGPGRASNSTASVNGSATFHFVLDGNIQTLSDQNAPKEGSIKGLLFVPALNDDDDCRNITTPYIPANVTRHRDVAPFGYQAIGLAPWVTPGCSQSFLEASMRVGTEALVFFLPSSDDKPPPADDSTWLLNDGHSWKSENLYPVYAIPGAAGTVLMEQLSRYSGNGTVSEGQQNGSTASSQGDRWDIRLFTLIDLENSGKRTPSIWGFLLAVLGTILVLCIILLLLYQIIQKRRRQDLQRRLEASEVGFEQYGLQHITVSPEFLAGLPIYVYPNHHGVGKDGPEQQNLCGNDKSGRSEDVLVESTRAEKTGEAETETPITDHSPRRVEDAPDMLNARKASVEVQKWPLSEPLPIATLNSNAPYSKHNNRLSHSQTTCAICLDDFIPASSTVRELPCGHIYHPECIDVSLTQHSSLCPLCKKSVLPPDFYPISMPDAIYQQDRMQRP